MEIALFALGKVDFALVCSAMETRSTNKKRKVDDEADVERKVDDEAAVKISDEDLRALVAEKCS